MSYKTVVLFLSACGALLDDIACNVPLLLSDDWLILVLIVGVEFAHLLPLDLKHVVRLS